MYPYQTNSFLFSMVCCFPITLLQQNPLFLGPPGNCTDVSGISSNKNSLSLMVSRCLGSAPITKYRIFYRLFGNSSEAWSYKVVLPIFPINLPSLTPFTEYEVIVSAGNEYGYGPNSSSIVVKTSEAGIRSFLVHEI